MLVTCSNCRKTLFVSSSSARAGETVAVCDGCRQELLVDAKGNVRPVPPPEPAGFASEAVAPAIAESPFGGFTPGPGEPAAPAIAESPFGGFAPGPGEPAATAGATPYPFAAFEPPPQAGEPFSGFAAPSPAGAPGTAPALPPPPGPEQAAAPFAWAPASPPPATASPGAWGVAVSPPMGSPEPVGSAAPTFGSFAPVPAPGTPDAGFSPQVPATELAYGAAQAPPGTLGGLDLLASAPLGAPTPDAVGEAAAFAPAWSPPGMTGAASPAPVLPPPEPPASLSPAPPPPTEAPLAPLQPLVPPVPGLFGTPVAPESPAPPGSPFGAGPLWPSGGARATMTDDVMVSRAFDTLAAPPAASPVESPMPPPVLREPPPLVAAPPPVPASFTRPASSEQVRPPSAAVSTPDEARERRPQHPALVLPPPLSPRVASPPPLCAAAPSLPPLRPAAEPAPQPATPALELSTRAGSAPAPSEPAQPEPAASPAPVAPSHAELALYAIEPEPLGTPSPSVASPSAPSTSHEVPVLLGQPRSSAPGVLRFNAAAADSEAPSIGQAAVTGPAPAAPRPADLWVPPVAAGLHAPDPTPTPAPRVSRRSMSTQLDDELEASLRRRRRGPLVALGIAILAAGAGAFYVLGPGRHRADDAPADASKTPEAGVAAVEPDAAPATPGDDKVDARERRHPRTHGGRTAKNTPRANPPAPARGGTARQPPPPAAPKQVAVAPPARPTPTSVPTPPAPAARSGAPAASPAPAPAASPAGVGRPGAPVAATAGPAAPAAAVTPGAAGRPATPASPTAAAPAAAAPTGDSYEIASEYLRQKKVQLAIDELKKGIAKNPRDAKSYRLLGMAYSLLGSEKSSVEAFERFVQLDPTHKDVPKVRAIIADYYKRHPR